MPDSVTAAGEVRGEATADATGSRERVDMSVGLWLGDYRDRARSPIVDHPEITQEGSSKQCLERQTTRREGDCCEFPVERVLRMGT